MKLSIVIPFYNEEENAEAVLREARAAQPDAEIVAVNDGSTDRTAEIIASLPDIRLISFPRNLGQSAALYAGLMQAQGDFLVPMDGDGQNDPADIQHLLARRDEFDVVCGYRKNRPRHLEHPHGLQGRESHTAAFHARRHSRRGLHLEADPARAHAALHALQRDAVLHDGDAAPQRTAHRRNPGQSPRAQVRPLEVHHRAARLAREFGICMGVAWLLRRNIAWPEGLPRPDSR